jgi:hypothetical protein
MIWRRTASIGAAPARKGVGDLEVDEQLIQKLAVEQIADHQVIRRAE